jgi:O-antigen ligase
VALLGAFFLLFILFVRPQEFVPALASLSILNVATACTVLGIAWEAFMGRVRWWTPQLPFLAAFLVWCVIATLIKVGLEPVLDMKTTILFSTIFMLLTMYATATFDRYRAVTGWLLAIVMALSFVCTRPATADFECIVLDKDEETGQASHDQSTGETTGQACESWHDCVSKSHDFTDDYVCERPGWFKTFTVAHGRVRWRGTLADPNELSVAIGAALSFAFAIHASSKRKLRHVFLIMCIALGVWCVILTGSRGGVLVLLAVFGTYFVRRYGAKGILAAAVFGSPVLLLGGRNDESAESSSLERLGALYEGMDFVKQNPILGLGQGQFGDNYFITAHNSYLLSAAELGIPGMICWTALIYVSVKIPWVLATNRPPELDPRFSDHGFALVTSFAGICVGIFFLSFTYHNMLFIYFGLAGGLYLAAKRACPSFEVTVKAKEIAWLAVFDVLLLVALFVYTRIKGAP